MKLISIRAHVNHWICRNIYILWGCFVFAVLCQLLIFFYFPQAMGSHQIRSLKRRQYISDAIIQTKLQEMLRERPIGTDIFASRFESIVSAPKSHISFSSKLSIKFTISQSPHYMIAHHHITCRESQKWKPIKAVEKEISNRTEAILSNIKWKYRFLSLEKLLSTKQWLMGKHIQEITRTRKISSPSWQRLVERNKEGSFERFTQNRCTLWKN